MCRPDIVAGNAVKVQGSCWRQTPRANSFPLFLNGSISPTYGRDWPTAMNDRFDVLGHLSENGCRDDSYKGRHSAIVDVGQCCSVALMAGMKWFWRLICSPNC